mmetsp:Transcript_9554/g.20273  ORF Transcript_9554/g.20273 Transcript_9554/m.20273 type:complete len:83 (+) Transcript_9554:323-571(+)
MYRYVKRHEPQPEPRQHSKEPGALGVYGTIICNNLQRYPTVHCTSIAFSRSRSRPGFYIHFTNKTTALNPRSKNAAEDSMFL